MRRLLVVPLLTLGLVAGSAQVAVGEDHRPKLPAQASDRASQALAAAKGALTGKGGGEATMALVELRKVYDALSAGEREQADALLARPTDGTGPAGETKYPAGAPLKVLCGEHVCVHYVSDSAYDDAPPLADGPDADVEPDWVQTTLGTMERVWAHQVTALGFRAPYGDGTKGGNAKFDVYLKNLGTPENLYGYCAPEDWVDLVDQTDYRASAYCALDNDFAEFPKPGVPSLRVTAAHEFFHAIQFAYDSYEDGWVMEATATWMEERFADDVNDNRNYLASGQLGDPGLSLDRWGGNSYGNWVFFELLSQLHGVGAMKALWGRMDSAHGAARNQYSTQAIRTFLASKKMPFPKFYARFAAGNLIPNRTYSEGAAYRPAPITAGYKLTSGTKSTGKRSPRVNHLTSKSYRFVAGASLRGRWRLKVNVDLPAPGTGSAAYLIVHRRDGSKAHKPVTLNRYGNATAYVGFSRSTVAAVTLTLANGSTRFKDCWVRQTPYSCSGAPLDNGRVYSFKATAVR